LLRLLILTHDPVCLDIADSSSPYFILNLFFHKRHIYYHIAAYSVKKVRLKCTQYLLFQSRRARLVQNFICFECAGLSSKDQGC